MDLSELRDLDPNNLGSASTGTKAVVLGFLAILIVAGGYWFLIKDKQTDLQRREATEVELKQEFRDNQQKAVNLTAYERQLEEMEELLAGMLQQLPSKTEMPALLMDISQTAQGSGIGTELFEPRAEIVRDFYAEQPISVRLVGTYHEFGTFVSSVASLSRVVILTMRDIELEPIEGGRLRMEGTVTTYRYLDPNEQNNMQPENR
ncbi:type 4a pilus biogenesis protein PilO [Wenzhouxiangella marina]|uniref:Fimbrial protein n=1 Tax=Wenzhouxiangella marina TaxID=1579979 RepID=A0A0K0XYS3_9GAMM|nr:type 4a pilus biogenesis protein PilO [Wenzhouxiangella marina]AKS42844.1 fimbrial protein [Wenzhouxiangella marina]MBB6087475.1 type IV pilus assembly protein PilO [Wenzhouxiangella marina]